MFLELLERIFLHRDQATSRSKVKQRLKSILAHDRASITPKMFEDMRAEIMKVVSKYVELDEESLQINLETDQRTTAVIANLPIRAIREEEPPQAAPEPDFDFIPAEDTSPEAQTASDKLPEATDPVVAETPTEQQTGVSETQPEAIAALETETPEQPIEPEAQPEAIAASETPEQPIEPEAPEDSKQDLSPSQPEVTE